jgi:hypothetical protein
VQADVAERVVAGGGERGAEAAVASVEHLLTYGGDRGYVNTPCQRAKSARARRAAATSATAPRSQRQPITSAH